MPISGSRIVAPISMKDIQNLIGITGDGNFERLILEAKYGGSNNGTYNQAFWTSEHYKEGTSGISYLISKTEPYFNIFSEIGPVEWVHFGEEIRPKLRTADFLKPSQNNLNYGFNFNDFDGYDHSSIKAELSMPTTLVSYDKIVKRDIVYQFPRWLSNKLPHLEGRKCWVLTGVPPDAPGYNFPFIAVWGQEEINEAALFKATLTGMPQYKDESIELKLYVSVWVYNGNFNPELDMDHTHYTFGYKMPDIGKAYTTTTLVTGGNNRPAETVNMQIEINPYTTGTVGSGYYTRLSANEVEITLIELNLFKNADLIIAETGYTIGLLSQGYYSKYTEVINFPNINYDRFIIR